MKRNFVADQKKIINVIREQNTIVQAVIIPIWTVQLKCSEHNKKSLEHKNLQITKVQEKIKNKSGNP